MVEQNDRLKLSNAGFGCWQLGCKDESDYWGLEFTQELADKLIGLAVNEGITYIDTAEVYSEGRSETQLGEALKKLPTELRQKVVIGSKILPQNCAEDNVEKHCNDSLARLQVECIELYMVHWPIEAVEGRTCAGAFRALKKLVEAGKIKHVGVSNFGPNQLKEALACGVKIAVNQVCYNLVTRAVEFEILPICKENDIQIICYSPLMQGLLTGRWTSTSEISEFRKRTRHFNKDATAKGRHGEEGHEDLMWKAIADCKAIADKAGLALADVANAWPLTTEGVTCVIIGATKEEQVKSNAAAVQLKLEPSVVAELNAATEALKQAMGPHCDIYEGIPNQRVK